MKPPVGGPGQEGRGTGVPSSPGHVRCCICTDLILLSEYRTARCWTDPNGITCAAHALCLIRVGEREIGLR